MKVYIAGPITGYEDGNRAVFDAAEASLRAAGHEPVNPHALHGGALDLSHGEYMRTDLRAMLDCEAIHMLNGWGNSKGALLEYRVAQAIGLVFVNVNGKPRGSVA